jgi:hypothetical protein
MRIILAFTLVALASCTAVVRSPVPLEPDTTVGIVSFVGDIAKNRTWGVTIFGNSDLSKQVDWEINNYLTSELQEKVTSYGMKSIIISNESDIQGLSGDTLDGLSRLRGEVISTMDQLKAKYGVDIIILAKEYRRGEGDSKLFTEGYGVTKYPNGTFIHTNITLYSIEIEYRNFFHPSRLDGYAFQGFAKRANDSRPGLIDKEGGLVLLDSTTRDKVKSNIDNILDWYFSQYPVVPAS